MKFKKWIHLIMFIILLMLLLCGIYSMVFGIDKQQCSMTYMWESPKFKRHYPITNASTPSQWYGLYHYSEADHAAVLKGVPVLFVHGNAGSYKQVRSLASVSRQMSLRTGHGTQLFDYFSVDLNEELSALSAAIIKRQIHYVDACLAYIGSLYGDGRAIVIISHSMGGVVARSVVARTGHPVSMIIALASPLAIPVAGVDRDMIGLYRQISSDRSRDVALVSLTGGNRDLLVWDGYGHVTAATHALWLPAFSVAGVTASTDHLSIMWCRQLIIAINKALYDSLSLGHNPAPRALLALMQRHLQPKLPINDYTNTSIDHYYSLVFRPIRVSVPPRKLRQYRISLPALTSVTRPLRLQIVASDCPRVSSTKTLLFTTHNTHTHTFTAQHDPLLLSLAEATNTHAPPQLHLDLVPECAYTLVAYSSLLDWTAHSIRIHAGRMPAIISALIILPSSTSSLPHAPLDVVVLIATMWLSSYSTMFTDITWMYTHTGADIADLTLLVSLCLPLAWLITSIGSLINATFRTLPAFSVRALTTMLLPPAVLLAITCQPLAYIPLLILHLLTIRRAKMATPITTAIIVTFLLDVPPLFAEYHSQMQHLDAVDIVTGAIRTLTTIDGYGVPRLTLVMTAITVMLRLIETHRHRMVPSIVMATGIRLTTLILASCCLIFCVVNVSQCGTYVVGAVLLAEMCTVLSDTDTK